MYKQNIELLLS